MQLKRTHVGDKALVTEHLVYLAEHMLRRTNHKTWARWRDSLSRMSRASRIMVGCGCERGERREAVKEVKHSWKRLRGEVHDAKSEMHALKED